MIPGDGTGAQPERQRPTFDAFLRLIRFDRPIGWLLLLWPTLLALWLAAGGFPPWPELLIFTAGVFLTRSAGCIINDYADRWLDPQVARTRLRPLATGELSGRFALGAFGVLMALAFGLVCLTNRTTVGLSGLALALAVLYPYCKRVMPVPQLVLGLAFSMGIPMAYTALGRWPDASACLLVLANLAWTTAYDTQYAMVDREDDRRAGALSTALLFGTHDRLAIGLLQALALSAMAAVGVLERLGWPYGLGLAIVLVLFTLQARWTWQREPTACFRAFKHNQWVGLVWFGGAMAALLH